MNQRRSLKDHDISRLLSSSVDQLNVLRALALENVELEKFTS